MSDSKRDIFTNSGGWRLIHSVPPAPAGSDEWRLRVIETALIHAETPFKTRRAPDGFIDILAPAEYAVEAELALMRVAEALNAAPSPPEPEEPEEAAASAEAPMEDPAEPEIPPAEQILSSEPGLGEIAHLSGVGYELRVGPEPHYAIPEAEWEEFLDISAQRQEFAILLEKEYERLYGHLRAEKRFADFIRLVERIYRGADAEDAPGDFLRAAGWMLAAGLVLAGLAALLRRLG